MFSYRAPNPGLLQSFFSSLTFTLLNFKVREIILPSLTYAAQHVSTEQLQAVATQYHLTIQQGIVVTYDDAKLSTMQFEPVGLVDTPKEDRRYIVKFFGNKGLWENGDKIERCAADANALQATLVCFNYRGVGYSTKPPVVFNDVVVDGIAQVQRLLDQHIKPENITLDGVSFGGAVATKVAAYYHRQDIKLYLWNDRSFSSLFKTAIYMYCTSDLAALMVYPVFWTAMNAIGWDDDIAADYIMISPEYKRHTVVAKQSICSPGDGVIGHPASLYKSVRSHEKKHGSLTGYKFVTRSHDSHVGHDKTRHRLFHKTSNVINRDRTAQHLYEAFVRRIP